MSNNELTQQKPTTAPHCITLDNRHEMTISGALDVESFADECICVITSMGKLTIKGEKLHINSFSVDDGILRASGCVDIMEYSKAKDTEAGFFARIFK